MNLNRTAHFCIPRWSGMVMAGLLTASVSAVATDSKVLPQPNWEKADALREVALSPRQETLSAWLRQVDEGEAASLLLSLQNTNPAGQPAFEAPLFDLAVSLAEAPLKDETDAQINELLLWLEAYSPGVLIPHEEHPDYGVPLYPVAAAAMGTRAERQRRLAEIQSGHMLNADPYVWRQRFLSSSPTDQKAMTQSLHGAAADWLPALATDLNQQLPLHPELAPPAGAAASALADAQLLLDAYRYSQGADAVALLREANWQLDSVQRSELLAGVMQLQDVGKAALGISLLAPGLQSKPQVSESLLDLMADPELGATAALALAGHPDPVVQSRLQDMLQAGGLVSNRAAIALDRSLYLESAGDSQ